MTPDPESNMNGSSNYASGISGGTTNSSATTDAAGAGGGGGLSEGMADFRIDNPMPHRLPEGENATPLEVTGTTASEKLVIIMVGLPATGKTHISKRICRFLSFFHDIPSQIYNVGDYRRQLYGDFLPYVSFFFLNVFWRVS
jgi:hypothetical protein